MAEKNARVITKQTSVPGKIPSGTTGNESNLIRQGELAINTSDKALYSFDGTNVFEIGEGRFFRVTGGTITGDVNVVGNLTATTLYSGGTDLSNIFAPISETGDITRIGPGINTFTGGTENNPTVNVTGLSIDNITVSGESSFQGISAVTFYSGSTDLSLLIGSGGGGGGDTTRVQPGINTFTGGTENEPTVNVTGLTVDNITVSGSASANTFSAATLVSGTTDVEDVIRTIAAETELNDLTRVQDGINTFTGGTANAPTVNVTGLSIDNISVSGSASANTFSADTLVSGTTDLNEIFAPITVTGDVTRVGNGTNTFTGGTENNPTVNVTGLTVDNFTVSGSASANTFSAATFVSGTTDVEDVIRTIAAETELNDLTRVQDGINTFTGGTANAPTVNVTGLSIDNIAISGEASFQGISASTLFSGSTDLSELFAPAGSDNNDITRVQPGTNTFTGGTANEPTVNVTGLTVDNFTVSGSASANTFSAATFVSGTTDLSDIFVTTTNTFLNGIRNISGDTYGLGGFLTEDTTVSGNSKSLFLGDANDRLGYSEINLGDGLYVSNTGNGNSAFGEYMEFVNTGDIGEDAVISIRSYSRGTLGSHQADIFLLAGSNSSGEYFGVPFENTEGRIYLTAYNGETGTTAIESWGFKADGEQGQIRMQRRHEDGVLLTGLYIDETGANQGIRLRDQNDGLGFGFTNRTVDESNVTWATDDDNIPSIGLIKENLTGFTLDNISISGSASANTFSAGTFYSGTTDLNDIFATSGSQTKVQPGVNTYTGGTDQFPTVNVTGLTIDNLTVSGSASANTFSAATFFSGTTDVEDVIRTIAAETELNDLTRVQDGINTFTGGTANAPTVNVTGLSIDNIAISGEASFQGISASTIFSGSTDIYDIFAPAGSNTDDVTRVQPGINTFTGGTGNEPTVNVTGLSIDNISISGSASANTFSAGTFYSGTTDVEDVIRTIAAETELNDLTRVQDGINTFTGGTENNPTVNVTGLTVDNFTVSGSASANTFSAATFVSGTTDLGDIFAYAGSQTKIQPGVNTFTGGTDQFPTVNVTGLTVDNITVSGSASANTFSADTFYSGTTDLSEIFAPINGVGILRNEDELLTSVSAYTTISTFSGVSTNSARFIEHYLTAYRNNDDYGFWKRTLAVNNVTGSVNIVFESADLDAQSSGLTTTDVIYSASGDDIIVRVSGEEAKTYNWTSTWEVVDEGVAIGEATGQTGSTTTTFNPIVTEPVTSIVNLTDEETVVGIDTSLSAITVNLPDSVATGQITYFVKDIGFNAVTNNITINPNGSDNIYFTSIVSAVTINTNGGAYILTNNGSGSWYIM